jgi:hypothetical protein
MALVPQRTSIPFIGGQEQQISKELVDPPLLLKAHNVIPVRNGGLAKRPGWICEDFSVHGFPYLPQPERIARRGNEILWIGGSVTTIRLNHYPPTLISRATAEATENASPPVWSAKGAVPRFNTRKLLDVTHSNIGESIGAWDCAFAGDSESGQGVVCMVWRSTNYSETDSTIEYAVIDVETRSILAQAKLNIGAYAHSFARVVAAKHPDGAWRFHVFYAVHIEFDECSIWHAVIPAATPWTVPINELTFGASTGFDVYASDAAADEARIVFTRTEYATVGVYGGLFLTTSGDALVLQVSTLHLFTAVTNGTPIYWTASIVCDPDGSEAAVHLGVMSPGCAGTPSNVLVNFTVDYPPDHGISSHYDVIASPYPDITRDDDGGQQVGWAGDRYLGSTFRRDNWWVFWKTSAENVFKSALFQAQSGYALTEDTPLGATASLIAWGRPFHHNGQSYILVSRGQMPDSTGIEIAAPYREGVTGGDPVTSYRIAARVTRGDVAFDSVFARENGVPLCRGRNSVVESFYQRGLFFTAIPTITLDGREHVISLFELDARDPQRFAWVEAFGDTFFASSIPWTYDGGTGHELGFPCRPQSLSGEISLSEVDSPTGGLGTPPQVYYVKAVWEGIDSMGRLVRSGVSLANPITISAPLKTIAVTYLNLCVTTHKDVRLAIYVSEDQGITYVRSEQLIKNAQYATTPTTVTLDPRRLFQLGQPTIYTDRMLPCDPPIPAQLICEWQRRIWLVNGRTVSPSHEVIDGEEPAFSDELRFQLSRDATGIAPYDDRLVIWAKDAIFWISGDGPNDLGVDGSFMQPQRLPTDFGCIDARSIVRTERGICFQSERGIELLDRGLGTGVISDGVAKTVREDGYSEILSASWDQATQICRFLVQNPSTGAFLVLCWHTLYSWWTTASIPGTGRPDYTDQPNGVLRAAGANWMALGDRSARNSNPTCRLARETGPVGATYLDRAETGYTGPDANHWYQAEIETANIKLDGLLGFVRVWRAEVLTSDQRAFTGISIACIADYANIESTAPRTWESESEVSAAAINSDHHAFPVHLKDQQVQAIRLKIKDLQFPTSWSGATETFLNFTGFSLYWGQQPGSGRRAESAKK